MSTVKNHCDEHLVYQGDHYTVINPFGCNNCRIAENNYKLDQINKESEQWLLINKQAIMAPNREFRIGSETLYWVFRNDSEYSLVRQAVWKGKIVGVIDVNSLYKKVGINFIFGMFRMFDNYHWYYDLEYKSVDQAEKIIEKYLSERQWIFERLSLENKR